jgi:hypothetical protein
MVATPLRTTSTVAFSESSWFAWMNPARCDTDGNVFVVAVPEADPRDVKNAPAPPQYTKKPSDILRVSADGKKRIRFSPAAVPAFANAEEVNTIATALSPSGTLFALVWAPRGQAGSQHIVSFDETGQYRSQIEVNVEEMVVQGFEVFGSGEFLLWGTRPWGGPRVSIMSGSSGDLLQDVVDEDSGRTPKVSNHVTRAGDGQIYFVPQGQESIHAVAPSGLSKYAFRLARVPRNWRLLDLKAAGPRRIAATYYEERPGQNSGRAWFAVYDALLGEQLAVYGPASGAPLCYEQSGRQDLFTVLKDARCLLRLSPS